jgi:CHAT domain-containing protein/2-oxoacid dehydrogenase-like protein with E3 subunit-binding domain/biotin-dependent enzyme
VAVIELAIVPGQAAGTFRVDVVSSPAGEASAVVFLDVEALLSRREQLELVVLASAAAGRAFLPRTERPLREIGQMLFSALLGSGDVAGRYRASAALAAERGEGLRVVLRVDTPALAGLPWEAMYDDVAGGYVCRREQLVRHVPVPAVVPPLLIAPPLRILGIISSPRGLPALDVEKEQEQLTRALARLRGQRLIEMHWADEATWGGLQDLLLSGHWHVVHFIGHGDFDIGRDEGVLALTREDGRADLVEADRLVDLLHEARPMPRLVVLNSCSGAATGANDLFASTAAALVRGGVSAVAAMQFSISDPAAVAFARGFYTAITHGRGVDEATSSGRVAILGTGSRTLEWVTPVMYLRGRDSRLFTLQSPPTSLPQHVERLANAELARAAVSDDRVDASPPRGAQEAPREAPEAIPTIRPSSEPGAVVMPRPNERIASGIVSRWLKRANDPVEAGEDLVEITTAEGVIKIPSPIAGFLYRIDIPTRATVTAGRVLALVKEGEPPVSKPAEDMPYVTPLVSKLALEMGVDLASIVGTGVGGRIRKQDVVDAARAIRARSPDVRG